MSEFLSFLVTGIVIGSIYAVSATGLVVTYTTTGVFNFAHGAVGVLLAYLFWQLWQGWGLPEAVALALTLVVAAPLFGAVLERVVMRPLYRSPSAVRLAVTVGLFLMLLALVQTLWSPAANTYTIPHFFQGDQVSIGGINVTVEQLVTIGVAVVAALSLRLFFTRTVTGLSMRAVVDDTELAQLSGTPTGRISSLAWMIGVFFAGVAGILYAPTTMSVLPLAELVVYGYAAAVLGRLRSIPLTFVGAMALGIAYSMAVGYVPSNVLSDVTAALPMVLLIVVLLALPEVRLAIGRLPSRYLVRPASLRSTLLGAAALVAVAAVLAGVLQGNNLVTLGNVLVFALAGLSVVTLAGWAGQVSLCQFTFLGLGALAMHWVGGGSSVLGLVAAVALCGAAGAVVAFPALRLRGIYLALATLAFAVLMDNVFFVSQSVMGSGGTVAVGRPDLFGQRFSGDGAFDVLLAVVLAAALVAVGALRRGKLGRRLVAMNESPAGYATVGLSVWTTRLAIFAFSAALAGLAGALYGGLSTAVGAQQFSFVQSITLFAAVAMSGLNVLSAAVAAGIFLGIGPVIGTHVPALGANFTGLLVGAGIVMVGRNPAGVARLFARG